MSPTDERGARTVTSAPAGLTTRAPSRDDPPNQHLTDAPILQL